MDVELIERIVPELRDALIDTRLRNIFQLRPGRLVLAFEGDELHLLFLSVEPNDSRIYLIRRRARDLKKLSTHPSHFAISLEKVLAGTTVNSLDQIGVDRIIELRFPQHRLIVQLTGKSSNLLILDSEGTVIGVLRRLVGEGQTTGSSYEPPKRVRVDPANVAPKLVLEGPSISEALDDYFRSVDERHEFEALADAARAKNRHEITKLNRLVKNLNNDLAEHGDAEKWKRFGDLLLANQSTAMRKGSVIRVRDLFDEGTPLVDIEADDNDSIAEAAQKYFRRYTKARNSRTAVENRLKSLNFEKQRLEDLREKIENAIHEEDRELLIEFIGKKGAEHQRATRKRPTIPSGIRTFLSSDGFEILVGKKATDNDVLTSRVANSRDMWMHSADYPGSHVIIRNASKKEIPHRTLIEAAQLAAFYSQGKKQPKAAVHYTLKKFVSKPKGAAPGLVRLASIKTILVEPKIGDVKSIIR